MKYFRWINILVSLLTATLLVSLSIDRDIPFFSFSADRVLAFVYDLHTRTNNFLSTPTPSSRITIVEIDDATLSATASHFGRWPWRRDYQIALFNQILKNDPHKLIIDIIYPERDRSPIPEGLLKELTPGQISNFTNKYEPDTLLLKFLSLNKTRILLTGVAPSICEQEHCTNDSVIDDLGPFTQKLLLRQSKTFEGHIPKEAQKKLPQLESPLLPYDALSAVVEHLGLSMSVPDGDGIIRKQRDFYVLNRWIIPSMPLALKSPNQQAWNSNSSYIKFYPENTFQRLSALSLIEGSDPDLKRLIKDQIVIVGMTATAGSDIHNTPLGLRSGPEILATTIQNYLAGERIYRESSRHLAVYLLLVLIFFMLTDRLAKRGTGSRIVVFFIIMFLILIISDIIAFQDHRLSLSVFLQAQLLILFSTLTLFKYFEAEKRKRFIKKAFASYISPKLVDQMVQDPSLLKLGGHKKELTIMFSDIRSFTSFSEKMDPKDLADFLNEYLTAMTDIVFETDGTLDKYIGDAVMAFWGAPIDVQQQPYKALQATIKMMKWIAEKRQVILERYQVPIEVGIGVNTGTVSVGNLGSQKSLGYTVIGDDVNLTSRLEGATKVYGVEILTTENTMAKLSTEELKSIQYRRLDYLTVKGRNRPVQIFEVFHESMPNELLAAFDEGMVNYLSQQWEAAENAFNQCIVTANSVLKKTDKTAEIFLQRIDYLRKHPPGDRWDGSWKLDSK